MYVCSCECVCSPLCKCQKPVALFKIIALFAQSEHESANCPRAIRTVRAISGRPEPAASTGRDLSTAETPCPKTATCCGNPSAGSFRSTTACASEVKPPTFRGTFSHFSHRNADGNGTRGTRNTTHLGGESIAHGNGPGIGRN